MLYEMSTREQCRVSGNTTDMGEALRSLSRSILFLYHRRKKVENVSQNIITFILQTFSEIRKKGNYLCEKYRSYIATPCRRI